jgi:hypothetical protein
VPSLRWDTSALACSTLATSTDAHRGTRGGPVDKARRVRGGAEHKVSRGMGRWEGARGLGKTCVGRGRRGGRGLARAGRSAAARRVLAWICCGVPLFDCAFLKISQLKCTE